MNPYEPPQTSLEQRPVELPRLASEDEPLPKILLVKLVLCCVLIMGEIYLAFVFLDLVLAAWGIYHGPLLPGSDHLKPQHLVYCLMGNGFLIHWVWRSMD
jgi:hypothetical protein